jgi:hypothetical protein
VKDEVMKGIKLLMSSPVGMARSVKRLATGWKVRGSNTGGGEIFRTRPNEL